MEELNVFSLRIFLALAFCLVCFYFLGSLLIGRMRNPFVSVAVKLSFGGLSFISLIATVHAGIQTGLLFFVLLFIVVGTINRFRPDISDLKDLGLIRAVLIATCFFALLVEEGYRSDLLIDDNIYVGNSDVSFYSSFGHSMYNSGYETNPENITPEMRGAVYHFGDLWFSGFFSNFFGVIPYYAYNVLFRVFALGVIVLSVFGWCHQISNKAWSAFLLAVTTVGAVYIDLFPVNFPEISILQTFSFLYPLYGYGSHMIVAMVVIPFSMYLLEKNWPIGACGLLLTPFLNAGLLIVPIIAMMLITGVYLIQKTLNRSIIRIKVIEVLLPLAVSAIPLSYYLVSDRLDPTGGNILSVEFLYLFTHTMARVTLSQILVLPFIFGFLWLLGPADEAKPKLLLIHVAFFAGTLIAFAFIYPQIQGNSTQILSMHFQGFLAPIGLVGLYGMVYSQSSRTIKKISTVLLVLIVAQAGRICINSKGFAPAFDWESYLPGYASSHKVKIDDWKNMRALLYDERTVFGYFVCDVHASGGVHYNEFTYLKSVLPGAVFIRLNPLPSDTTPSREMQGYYYRTSLGYFVKKNGGDPQGTERELINFLQPNYFVLPFDTSTYCIPDAWKGIIKSHVLRSDQKNFYEL